MLKREYLKVSLSKHTVEVFPFESFSIFSNPFLTLGLGIFDDATKMN